jgi:hypothetical protein
MIRAQVSVPGDPPSPLTLGGVRPELTPACFVPTTGRVGKWRGLPFSAWINLVA